ncbi:MAG: EF-hand domain-containing protein [Reyranella sp.]|nr:EF-hand domain-containing protein [Reyranella sp.]
MAALIVALGSAGTPSLGQSSAGPPPASRQASDPLAGAMSRWDMDHDGVLTCEEWRRFAEQLFRRSDRNGDGALDKQEFLALGQWEPVFAKADMAYFDDNQDGRLSLREFADKPNPIFVRYDRNHDCQVTAEEIKGTSSDGKQKPPPIGERGRGGTPGPPPSN